MVMLNVPRQSSLVLTRNGVLDTTWPAIRDLFPPGSTTEIRTYDSSGTVIATIIGEVTPTKLVYLAQPAELADIPGGAQYELMLITPDGPYVVEYGHVIRREAAFFTPPATSIEQDSRLFVDTLGRDSVGRRWVAVQGGVAMHSTPGGGYGMGPDIPLLFAAAGVRYQRPIGGDSFRCTFGVYSTRSALGVGGTGKMRFHGASDALMTTGMSFEMETGISNNRLHTGLVTAPIDISYTGSPVNHNTDTGEQFTVEYSDITKTMNVFLGAATTPIITWNDAGNVLPHGPGYRYWGFSWDSSLAATGALLVTVEMQDYV